MKQKPEANTKTFAIQSNTIQWKSSFLFHLTAKWPDSGFYGFSQEQAENICSFQNLAEKSHYRERKRGGDRTCDLSGKRNVFQIFGDDNMEIANCFWPVAY